MKHLVRIWLLIGFVLLFFLFGCNQRFSFLKQKSPLEKEINFCLKLAEISIDNSYCIDYYCDLSKLYNELGNYKKSQEYNEKWVEGIIRQNGMEDIKRVDSFDYYNKVISVCDEFISSDSQFIYAYMKKASAYMALQQTDRAFKVINKAIEIEPENADLYILRSAMYVKVNQGGESQMDEKKAKELLVQKSEKK
ncbi:hypothetical protein KAI68_05055 [bacterium]|nr:hypothetical protein [bacterium]